jgi:hypothetical protein
MALIINHFKKNNIMTEVSQSVYGVFVDCIEEVSFDGAENDQNEG